MRIVLFVLVLFIFVGTAGKASAQESLEELMTLPISELGKAKVYSVSKREEKASEAAAAVFVLTDEDIRRSGATNIPEVLRLVPGVQVARTSTNKWAISARGFNDGFANKLLVLIDGRSVFHPQFAGVFWDAQDTVLEDIERIEVIRGPGATLWGANAVNGVINITTKKARNTQGVLTSAATGNEEHLITQARYGGKVGNNSHYRTYAKHFTRNNYQTPTGVSVDNGWQFTRGGFRVDVEEHEDNSFTVQGDVYAGELDTTLLLPSFEMPPTLRIDDTGDIAGGNIIGRWHHIHNEDMDSTVQLYFDRMQRHFYNIEININTYDLEWQQVWDVNERNELVWGAGYRFVEDSFNNTKFFTYVPPSSNEEVFNAFIQNKYAFIPDELFFTVGSKLENNSYTGFEVQPNVRFTWLPKENNTVWGAISRSVRTPTRSEDDIELVVAAVPSAGFIRWLGDSNAQSEELIAYELGYRVEPMQGLNVDIATFFNDYSNIRTFEAVPAFGDNFLPFSVRNKGRAKSYGGEILVDWHVQPQWNLIASYSYLWLDVDLDADSTDAFTEVDQGKSPDHQFTLRSHYNLPYNVELDNMLYYVDNLPTATVAAYIRFDTRISWKATENMELSLVGQNLFDDWHREFGTAFNEDPMEVGRSIFGKVVWKF